jgi:hypothetical protein
MDEATYFEKEKMEWNVMYLYLENNLDGCTS